jgi:hypothetical protein
LIWPNGSSINFAVLLCLFHLGRIRIGSKHNKQQICKKESAFTFDSPERVATASLIQLAKLGEKTAARLKETRRTQGRLG